MPPKRQTLVPCNCTSCNGERVSPATRANHRNDDRQRQNQVQSTSTTSSSHLSTSPELDARWSVSIVEELSFLAMIPVVQPDRPLRFRQTPSNALPFALDVDADLHRPNRSVFALTNDLANRYYLEVERRVSELYQLIRSMTLEGQAELEEKLWVIMSNLVHEKHIQWEVQSDPNSQGNPHHVNTAIFFYRGSSRSRTYRCAVLTALVLYHIYRAPRRAVQVQLAGLRDILRSVNLPTEEIHSLPKDPRTTTTYYNLHPVTRKYIVCPKCHALYLWDGANAASLDAPVMWRCTFKPNTHWSDPLCDADLWRAKKLLDNRIVYRPIKIFTYQPLKYWLGRLLSRPGIEDHIDRACEITPNPEGIVDDIWTSPIIQSLEDHEGKPFFPAPPGESHLLFSLAMDGFNPLTMKAAHTQVSSTGIWFVLLNLPRHLRYLHENMCPAGVIPGPHKPSADEINSYLNLVTDDFLEIFHPGIFFSRTFKHQLGRLFKAMLIPLVCDMLAARQVVGQAGAPTAHDFCTVCDIDKDDIDVLDRRDWTPKDFDHIKDCAYQWQNASSAQQRDNLFQLYSIRWTPLFRLPYWDPTKHAVIDAMHTLDLGLLQNHVRVLFALSVDSPGGDGGVATPTEPTTKLVTTSKQVAAYRSCIDAIIANDSTALQVDLLRFHRKVLYTFCVENRIPTNPRGVVVTGTAWRLAKSIADWRNGPRYWTPQSNLIDLEQELETDAEDEAQQSTSSTEVDRGLLTIAKAVLKHIDENNSTNMQRLYSATTKKLYVDLLTHLTIEISHIDLAKKASKRQLHELLLEKIQSNGDGQYATRLRDLLADSVTSQHAIIHDNRTQDEDDTVDDDDQHGEIDKSLITVAKILLVIINKDTPINIQKLNKTATKKTYLSICDQLSIDYSTIDLDRRVAKQQLEDIILEKVRNDSTGVCEEILQGLLPESKPTGRVILGKEVMAVIWADMKATQTPTWVATAPPNWGTAERGKLSAAQWRVVCTIHLPVSLIRLWRHETGRLRQLLDHFMDLVSAVRAANMKVSSPTQIKAYDHYIFRYVSKIIELFPDENLKPSHHMALHMGEFLERMGPVHSYNSPYFERYINFFHHQNTNSHPGELETTLLNAAAHSGNLRATLQDDSEVRPLICQMVDRMDQIDKEDVRGYRLASILDPSSPSFTARADGKLVELPITARAPWQQYMTDHNLRSNRNASDNVLSYRQIAVGGVCYSTTNHIQRNSTVMFSDTSSPEALCSMTEYTDLRAAFVDLIFQPSLDAHRDFYMAIRELLPVEQGDLDPFKKYGFAGGFLCKNTASSTKIIHVNQVKCHAVLTAMNIGELGGEVYHVLCVDRLMNIFESHDSETEE